MMWASKLWLLVNLICLVTFATNFHGVAGTSEVQPSLSLVPEEIIFEEPSASAVETEAKTVIKTKAESRTCNFNYFMHYVAKDCTPVYLDGQTCPERYECLNEAAKGMLKDKCYYKGVEYEDGADMNIINQEHPCAFSCRCDSRSGVGAPRCAHPDCPFRRPPPGCRKLRDHNSCCTEEIVCEEATEGYTLDPATRIDAPTCEWNGVTYKLGEYIELGSVDLHCTECYCAEGFTGPSGPGCKNTTCSFDWRYRGRFNDGCVPIYLTSTCCNSDWMCPDSSKINRALLPQQGTDKTPFTGCKLGDIKIPLGVDLKMVDFEEWENVFTCTCSTPPELTCTYLAQL